MARPPVKKTRHKTTVEKLPKPSIERVAPPAVNLPSPESIATRAYEIWVLRNCRHGSDWQDWFEAEQQLVKSAKINTATL